MAHVDLRRVFPIDQPAFSGARWLLALALAGVLVAFFWICGVFSHLGESRTEAGVETSWGEIPAAAYVPGLLATGVPILLLAARPVWPVHRRIAATKREALARVQEEIDALAPPGQALPADLPTLAPLLTYRRELQAAPEWPFDLGVMARLAFYLIIPPLTWVGAALIENVVNAFL